MNSFKDIACQILKEAANKFELSASDKIEDTRLLNS